MPKSKIFLNAVAGAMLIASPMALSGAAWAADAPIGMPGDKYESVIEYQPHWYVAGRFGVAWNHDTEFGIPAVVTNEYETAFNFSGAFGREFDFATYNTRLELEIGYLTNEIDSHTVGGATFTGGAAFGDTNAFYGLVNTYIDFDNWGGPLTPYLSAGIGLANVDFDGHGIAAAPVVMNDDGTGFAWQVGAGVSYDMNDRVALELGYRFFNVENVGLTSVSGVNSDVDLRSHQINAGLRYRF